MKWPRKGCGEKQESKRDEQTEVPAERSIHSAEVAKPFPLLTAGPAHDLLLSSSRKNK